MTSAGIPYEHPDRLHAIITKYFGFFESEAGFTVTEYHYNAARLVGQMLLTRPDVVLQATLHEDELDFYVAPAGANPKFVKVNLLLLYFKRVPVNYAEFMSRPPAPEPSQDEIWREWGADIKQHLAQILQFAQAAGYEARLADQERYEAEVAKDTERQVAEYNARKAQAH